MDQLTVERSRFVSRNAQENWEFLGRAYGTGIRVHGEVSVSPLNYDRIAAGPLAWDNVMLPGDWSIDIDAVQGLLVTMPTAGQWQMELGGHDVRLPGTGAALVTPGMPYQARLTHIAVDVLSVGPALFDAFMHDAHAPPRRTTFTGLTPARPSDARLWATTAAYVHTTLANADLSDLIICQLARLTVACALQVFPNEILPDPLSMDSNDSTSDTLRRAMAFIEDNAYRDIGLAEIAASVPVTTRAVQYAFQRHANTTPLTYLRRVRLDGAHADLRAASPSTATVTDIAARWGFAHPGRFAAAYRSVYGTTPAATLHS
ncbi:AraC family transcriptional regulator [Streptomyces sp. NPDC057621]|uniref:AraC family transcriptional regulator n=1 Tax=Streptomyces sp. NPDC057621 TaxID=3346186 RepID=UPI0036C3DCD2